MIHDYKDLVWHAFLGTVGTLLSLVFVIVVFGLYPISVRLWDFLPYFSLFLFFLCLTSADEVIQWSRHRSFVP